jgi:uncharacterized membrane protein
MRRARIAPGRGSAAEALNPRANPGTLVAADRDHMAKLAPGKTSRRPRGPLAAAAPARPDWLVVAVAGAGVIVSGYLGWLKLQGANALLCEAGGGCDIVQASRYATILGVPTALWGTLLYLAVGALAALGLTAQRWLGAFLLAAAGAAFSVYLTALSVLAIGAACVYCLASLAIVLALLGVLAWRRPPAAGRRSPLRWSRVLALGGAAAAVAVVAGAAVFAAYPGGAAAYQGELARHLARSNAIMYGAYWCAHCQEQKARFGSAARDLPYVECDPRGVGARPDLCSLAGVRAYPTWVIGGQRREGVLSLEDLARLSGFSGASAKSGG